MMSLFPRFERVNVYFIGIVIFLGLMPAISGLIPMAFSSAIAFLMIFSWSLYASILRFAEINWPTGLMLAATIFLMSLVIGMLSTTDVAHAALISAKPFLFMSLLTLIHPWVFRMKRKDTKTLSFFLAVGLCVSSSYAMYDQGTILYFVEYDPNYLAIALLANLVACKTFRQHILFVLLSILLVLTFSRMAFLAYAVLFFRMRLALVLPLVGVIFFFFFLASATEFNLGIQLPEKLELILEADGAGEAMEELFKSSRLNYWSESIVLLDKNPNGIGVGMSPKFIGVTGFVGDVEFLSGARGNTPHNMLMTVFLEYGFINGFLFIGSLLFVFSYFVYLRVRMLSVLLLFIMLLDVHLQSVIFYFCACCFLAAQSIEEEAIRV